MVETLRIASKTLASLGIGPDRLAGERSMRAGLWIWPMVPLLDAYMGFVAHPGAPSA